MASPDSYISARAGRAYWQGVDADVNGMLGGIPAVSKIDLQGSRAFLAKLGVGRDRAGLRALTRALEGGAGYVFFLFPLFLALFVICSFFQMISFLSCGPRKRTMARNWVGGGFVALYRSWLAPGPAVLHSPPCHARLVLCAPALLFSRGIHR